MRISILAKYWDASYLWYITSVVDLSRSRKRAYDVILIRASPNITHDSDPNVRISRDKRGYLILSFLLVDIAHPAEIRTIDENVSSETHSHVSRINVMLDAEWKSGIDGELLCYARKLDTFAIRPDQVKRVFSNAMNAMRMRIRIILLIANITGTNPRLAPLGRLPSTSPRPSFYPYSRYHL